jgi:hypothetical protein
MEKVPEILTAERIGQGVLIEFADGQCRLYSKSLLRSALNQAVEIEELEADDSPAPPTAA